MDTKTLDPLPVYTCKEIDELGAKITGSCTASVQKVGEKFLVILITRLECYSLCIPAIDLIETFSGYIQEEAEKKGFATTRTRRVSSEMLGVSTTAIQKSVFISIFPKNT